MNKDIQFTVKPLNKVDNYYGFTVDKDNLYLSSDGLVHHNSGKSVLEQNIVAHISRFSDDFQCVGVL